MPFAKNLVPTHFPGDEAERRALDLYIKLLRATNTVTSRMNETVAPFDLTATQFGVLESLLHLGPLKPKQIAQKHLKSPNNITGVLEALEREGLVRREPDPKDGRSVDIHLTCEGRCRIARAFPPHVEEIVKVASALTPEEQITLAALLKKLGLQENAEKCGTTCSIAP